MQDTMVLDTGCWILIAGCEMLVDLNLGPESLMPKASHIYRIFHLDIADPEGVE